jgi:hypothetical protein
MSALGDRVEPARQRAGVEGWTPLRRELLETPPSLWRRRSIGKPRDVRDRARDESLGGSREPSPTADNAVRGAEERGIRDVRGPAGGGSARRASPLPEAGCPPSSNRWRSREIGRLANLLGHEHCCAGERSRQCATERGLRRAQTFSTNHAGLRMEGTCQKLEAPHSALRKNPREASVRQKAPEGFSAQCAARSAQCL